MDMPPSRYKVVEKGRRLVVVDRLTGEAVRHEHPVTLRQPEPRSGSSTMEPPRPSEQPRMEMRAPDPAPRARPLRGNGGMTITTDGWYDSKGPRVVQLSENAQIGLAAGGVALVVLTLILFATFGFPVLIIAVVLLANTRKAIRSGATAWLDGYAQD